MAKINLLPWRDELRKERQAQFLKVLLAVAVVAASGVVAANWTISGWKTNQEARNQYLESEISLLDKQIAEIDMLEKKKKELLTRMRIIQELQQSRPVIVRVFDELVRLVPSGITLSELARSGEVFKFKGQTEANARVAKFMRNLDDSLWFQKPSLSSITSTSKAKTIGGKEPPSDFVMQVQLELPDQEGGKK